MNNIPLCRNKAWDADFTKLTPQEAAELRLAHMQAARGEVFSDDEIDWDIAKELDISEARC